MSGWELAVFSRYPEFAEEVLLAQGATAVSFSDCADQPILEPGPGETPLWAQTLTRGLFADDTMLDAAGAALHELLPDGAGLRIERRFVADADWLQAWLQYAQPQRFGKPESPGLWVCPSGHHVDEAGAAIVRLDPGLAFGTGAHPSTALCLDWLATHEVAGKQVLDYGCGSGILAIAALKRGAAHALAMDIDPQALIATLDNAERNGVAGRLSCSDVGETCAQQPGQAVDIVLANILARPLIALAPILTARVAPRGCIVLAGILDTQVEEVRAAYAAGFDFEIEKSSEGWSRISGTRRAIP